MFCEPKDAISQARAKRVFAIIFATLERLLQSSDDDTPVTPKPTFTRTRSSTSHTSLPTVLADGTSFSMRSWFPVTTDAKNCPIADEEGTSSEDALESLLEAINEGMVRHAHFREMISQDQVEAIVPVLADYISMSAAPVTVSKTLLNNRDQVETLLGNVRDRCTSDGILQSQVSRLGIYCQALMLTKSLVLQITALIEQLRIGVVSPRGKNASLAFSPSSYSLSQMQSMSSYQSHSAFSPGSSSKLNPLSAVRTTRKTTVGRTRSAFERKLPLIRRLTGDFGNSEKKDKDLLWKQGIISAESTRFSKTVLDRLVWSSFGSYVYSYSEYSSTARTTGRESPIAIGQSNWP